MSVHGLKQNIQNPQKSTLGKKIMSFFKNMAISKKIGKSERQHRQVTYQIKANEETNTMRTKLDQNKVISPRHGSLNVKECIL